MPKLIHTILSAIIIVIFWIVIRWILKDYDSLSDEDKSKMDP